MVNEMIANYIGVIKKYIVFDGRARRKEYWYFVLCNVIISAALSVLGLIPFLGVLFRIASYLFSLFILVPSIAAGVRRLHDTNRTGYKMFLGFIPIAGFIILIIYCAEEGTKGENQYGQDPKGA